MSGRCAICGGGRFRSLGPNPDFDGLEIVRCRGCGLVITRPEPTGEELARRYEEEYRRVMGEAPTPQYLAFMDRRGKAQRDFVLDHAAIEIGRARVLDIGCSAGSFLRAMGELTPHLTGYEPDAAMAAQASRRLPPSASIVNGLFEPATISEGAFDLVAMSHVLEHVPEPVAFLRHLADAAPAGGHLFVEVPYETSWSVAEIIRARFRGKLHLAFFAPKTLRAAIEAAGWRVLVLKMFGPRRDRFSLVPYHHRALRFRVRDHLERNIRRLAKVTKLRAVAPTPSDPEMLTEENPGKGVYLRALAVRDPGRG